MFDEWYRIAKLFAQAKIDASSPFRLTLILDQMVFCTDDCLKTMFIVHAPGAFTKPNMDYYVISSLMKGFRNVLSILETKPKFQVLRENPNFLGIVSWLQQSILPQLVTGTKNDRVSASIVFSVD